ALAWCLATARRFGGRGAANPAPPPARFPARVATEGAPPPGQTTEDNLSWSLIRQTAATAGGIELERTVTGEGTTFNAMFTRTVQAVDGISAVDLSDDHSSMFKSLSGTYVLTISPTLQIRADVRDALREIGIVSDSVVDFVQARDAIKGRMPNLIVVDSEIKGADFEAFRRELL